ncbi:MAG: DUF2877 domain-containing protein [Bifidobacteriaceae bacterium]|jgi:hypothetical protein|nr:DUF2877 domain-containing protein [Bifidobacteriaceae bacterium]
MPTGRIADAPRGARRGCWPEASSNRAGATVTVDAALTRCGWFGPLATPGHPAGSANPVGGAARDPNRPAAPSLTLLHLSPDAAVFRAPDDTLLTAAGPGRWLVPGGIHVTDRAAWDRLLAACRAAGPGAAVSLAAWWAGLGPAAVATVDLTLPSADPRTVHIDRRAARATAEWAWDAPALPAGPAGLRRAALANGAALAEALRPGPAPGRTNQRDPRSGIGHHPVNLPPSASPRSGIGHLPAGGPSPLTGALTALIGAGPGTTPTGDDVIAGYLAGARAAGRRAAARRLAAALPPLLDRTTAASRHELRAAAAGRFSEPLLALAARLTRPRTGRAPDLEPLLTRLGTWGATSGRDQAWGLILGLTGRAPGPRPLTPPAAAAATTMEGQA